MSKASLADILAGGAEVEAEEGASSPLTLTTDFI